MLRGGRPKIEQERVPRSTANPKRAPRGSQRRNFMMRHLWYCGWGTAGLAGLAKLYEQAPDLAKKVTPLYISAWLAGAIVLPPYISRKKGAQKTEASKVEDEVVVKM